MRTDNPVYAFGSHMTGAIKTVDETIDECLSQADEIADLREEVAALNEVILQKDITISQFECTIEELEICARGEIAKAARDTIPANRDGWYISDIEFYGEV